MTAASAPPLDDLLEHRSWVRHLARTLVRDAASADDVEQQVWLAALRAPPTDLSSPRAWLGTVTRNVVRRLRRSETRVRRRENAFAARASAARPPTDEVVERAESHRRVVDAVLALPDPQRGAVLLRYFEGLAVADVAARLGVPHETARSRLRVARDRLRERLAPDAATAHSLGVLALARGALDGVHGASAASAASDAVTTGVLVMTTATKVTGVVAAVLVLGLGTAWLAARDDAAQQAAEAHRLRSEVGALRDALDDAGTVAQRARRAATATQRRGGATLTAPDDTGTEPVAADTGGAGSTGPRGDPVSPATEAEGAAIPTPQERDRPEDPASSAAWRRRILAALEHTPDGEEHSWAIGELRNRLLEDPAGDDGLWADRMLDNAAREGNVGPEEAADLARAYAALSRDDPAAPALAAAAAVGWTRDARLDGFLSGVPTGDCRDVHLRLLRTLDHHPTDSFARYVVRVVREEQDPAVLSSAFDEDRAAAAASTPDRARDVVAAYATRMRDPEVSPGLAAQGCFALALAGLAAPDESAAELRRFAATLPADDRQRASLTRAADLLSTRRATAKSLEDALE